MHTEVMSPRWPFPPMEKRLFLALMTTQSKSGMQVHMLISLPVSLKLAALLPCNYAAMQLCCSRKLSPTECCQHADSLQLMDERAGSMAILDMSGQAADVLGSSLHLHDGRRFYSPSPIQTVAMHLPLLVAGAQSGELYLLEV